MIQYLAYPLVILIVCLVGMRMFRRQLSSLIDRTQKIGPTGLDATGTPAQQTALEATTTAGQGVISAPKSGSYVEFQKAIAQFRFPMMERKAEEVKKQVDFTAFTEEQLREIMTDLSGLVWMAVEFETVFSLIFGSQMLALQDLNTVFAIGRHTNEVRKFYDVAASAAPEVYQTFSFEQWLNFLVSRNLIAIDEQRIVKITSDGRDFLRYLVQTGKSFFKAY